MDSGLSQGRLDFLENVCFGICVVLCCIFFLESLSYVFVESAINV